MSDSDREPNPDVRTNEPEVLDPPSVARALVEMFELARTLPPEDLVRLAQDLASASGSTRTRVYLADYGQRVLMPFGDAEAGPFEIDGTIGGRAYLLSDSVEIDERDHTVVWFPLRDGVDRLGVIQFHVEGIDEARRGTLRQISAVVASELVSRGQYTDTVKTAYDAAGS